MGCYTVKSAYGMLRNQDAANEFQSNTQFWKRLWSLKLPPKVKQFLWRALTDCLPTKDNLQTRKWLLIVLVRCVIMIRRQCYICWLSVSLLRYVGIMLELCKTLLSVLVSGSGYLKLLTIIQKMKFT